MLRSIIIVIFCCLLFSCAWIIPDREPNWDNTEKIPGYKSGEFNSFYKRYSNLHEKEINKAREKERKEAGEVIELTELENVEYALYPDITISKKEYNNQYQVLCQVGVDGNSMIYLEEYKAYTTYAYYISHSEKTIQDQDNNRFRDTTREQFLDNGKYTRNYLPFRWANRSDMVSFIFNDESSNKLVIGFLGLEENQFRFKKFLISDNKSEIFLFDPVWSNDDEYLACSEFTKDKNKVYIYNLDKRKTEVKSPTGYHCFRFSPEGTNGFAVQESEGKYIPVYIKNWKDWDEPSEIMIFKELSTSCPYMYASFSQDGERIALIQYKDSLMTEINLAIIDLDKKPAKVYQKSRKLNSSGQNNAVVPKGIPGDPIWYGDDNFVIFNSKDTVFWSYVNKESLDKEYIYLNIYTKENDKIDELTSASYSPITNTIYYFQEDEFYDVLEMKITIKENVPGEDNKFHYYKTTISDYRIEQDSLNNRTEFVTLKRKSKPAIESEIDNKNRNIGKVMLKKNKNTGDNIYVLELSDEVVYKKICDSDTEPDSKKLEEVYLEWSDRVTEKKKITKGDFRLDTRLRQQGVERNN